MSTASGRSATGSAAGSDKPASSPSSTSATPCAFFAQGKCRHGADCKFYHAPRKDLAVSPVPCKFFLQNACTAGRNCKFSHAPELQQARRQVSASTRDANLKPGAFGVPCKFFKNGECSAGDRCPYVHQKPKPASTVKMYSLTKPKPSAVEQQVVANGTGDDEEKAPVAAAEPPKDEAAASGSDRDVTELSEFISKEEGALIAWMRPIGG